MWNLRVLLYIFNLGLALPEKKKRTVVWLFTNILLREALYWLRLSTWCKYTALEALAVAGWIDFLWWDRPWICVWKSETAAVYFCVSLSVTMLCQGHFQPSFYPPLLFTTPSFSSHSLSVPTLHHVFFSFWHSVFSSSISEYIVASGCECALSTCCNLDRCSLPLSLSPSLSAFLSSSISAS